MEVIIRTVGTPDGQVDPEVGATVRTEMERIPRIGETLHYHNEINETVIFVRISDIHNKVRVTKKGEVKESAVLTGIVTADS